MRAAERSNTLLRRLGLAFALSATVPASAATQTVFTCEYAGEWGAEKEVFRVTSSSWERLTDGKWDFMGCGSAAERPVSVTCTDDGISYRWRYHGHYAPRDPDTVQTFFINKSTKAFRYVAEEGANERVYRGACK